VAVLQKQIVQILLKGINQKDPDAIGVPGGLEIAENVRIDRGQEAGFEFVRRNGLTQVAALVPNAGGGGSGGFRMASYDGGLLARSASNGFQRYVPGVGFTRIPPVETFVERSPLGISRRDILVPIKAAAGTQTPTQSNKDVAYYQTTACYVWVDQDGGAQYQVRNAAGGVVMSGVTVATGASKTKVVVLGSTFYVFWKEANAIKATTILATSPYTVVAPTTVIAAGGALAGTDYDVITGFDSTHIALLYRSAAGTYVRCLLSTALAVGTTVSDATAANQPDVALCWIPAGVQQGLLYYGTLNAANGAKLQSINQTTLAITATSSDAGAVVAGVDNMAGGVYAGSPFLLIEYHANDAAGVTHQHVMWTVASGAGNSGPISDACGLASRVGYIGTGSQGPLAVVALVYKSTQAAGSVVAPQQTYFLAAVSPSGATRAGSIIGKALPGKAGAPTTFALSSLAADGSGVLHFLGANAVSADTKSGAVVLQYGLSDVALTLSPSVVTGALAFGGVSLWPGSNVTEIDAAGDNNIHEQGFDLKPEKLTLVEGAAASGSIVAGTRSYVARWKWLDSASQKYVSAMSTPALITTVNANSSVQATLFPPAAATNRGTIQVEIFCTPVGGTGDVYYRVTPSVYAGDTFTNGVLTFVDQHSEATLLAGEPFEPVTELENISPPALNDIIEHKNRPFGIDAEQPWRIRFGKEYTPGTSVGFTDAFIVETPDSTGPTYKIMSMDGHLIALKKDTIYVWAGDFPDNTGAGTIPSVTQLPVGVGTDQPRSVVLTDLGIIFYSSKRGFWLLNRSLGIEYIGAPVETTAANQTVSGATVHPTYPEVRFTTEGGTTFVLNTHFTRVAGAPVWTWFTGQACVHSIVHQGDWYLLTSDGKLKKEDLTSWQESVAYTVKVKISDLNFAGIGGLARVWRGQLLGQWYASHKVKVSLSLNHRSVAGQVFTFDATTDPDPYQLEFRLNAYESKQTSMDITIEDTTDFQTRGFAWDALMFVVGVKPGLFRRGKSFNMVGT